VADGVDLLPRSEQSVDLFELGSGRKGADAEEAESDVVMIGAALVLQS
jgi:hypothetical protein